MDESILDDCVGVKLSKKMQRLLEENLSFDEESEDEALIDECINFLVWFKEEIKDSLKYVKDPLIRKLFLTFESFIQFSIKTAEEDSE